MIDEKHKSLAWVWFTPLLIPLYLLSLGPAYWLWRHNLLSFGALAIYCAPCTWVSEHWTLFGDGMKAYILIWQS